MANDLKAIVPITTSGRKRAVVIRRDDPMLQGRIGVLIPELMPFADPNSADSLEVAENIDPSLAANKDIKPLIPSKVVTTNYVWARPPKDSKGSYDVPYKGQTVWVEMEDGDPSKLYYMTTGPSLNGETPPVDQISDTNSAYNAARKPNITILKSWADGSIMYYNENGDTREFVVKFANQAGITVADNGSDKKVEFRTARNDFCTLNEKEQNITIQTAGGHSAILDDKNKAITAKSSGGHSVKLDDGGSNISIDSSGGHSLTMDDGGGNVTIKEKSGNTLIMNAGGIQMTGNGGAKMTMKDGKVSFN
jgi:hypothetical protein